MREPAALPVYPAVALGARAGRNVVGVHITVDARGKVSGIRPSLLAFSTPGPFAGAFQESVEAALRQWQFTPARAEEIEIVHDGDASYNRVTGSENVETEFDLQFTFLPDGTVVQGN